MLGIATLTLLAALIVVFWALVVVGKRVVEL
jgi:hypothetical protein